MISSLVCKAKCILRQERILYISLFLIMFSFLGIKEESSGWLYIREPYSHFSTLIMCIGLLMAFIHTIAIGFKVNRTLVSLLCLYNLITILTLSINRVSIVLALYRILISLIPLLLSIIVFYFNQRNDAFNWLSKYIAMFSVWLSLQVILTAISTYIEVGSLNKRDIIVSIGSSNFIASILIITFIFLLFIERKFIGNWRPLILLINIIGIFFTFSSGAMTVLLFIVAVNVIHYILKMKSNRVTIITCTLMIIIIFVLVYLYIEGIILNNTSQNSIFYDFTYKITYKLQNLFKGNFESALAGRGAIYKEKINLIKDNILLGIGDTAQGDSFVRSHNWILDSLLLTGILGTICYISAIIYIFINIINKYYKNQSCKAVFYSLSAGMLHGLVEPNFFSKPFDFLWWLIALTSVAQLNRNYN